MKIIAAAVAACVVGAVAHTSPVQAFQSENTLRIGGLWAITGGVALTGKGALNLSRLAVEEINAADGVKVGGKQVKLELVAYDEACKPEEGLALTNRLANVDKVLFSLGPTCSGTAEPIFNTLQKNLEHIDFSILLTEVMTIADEIDSQLSQAMTSYVAASNDTKVPA